MLSHFPRLTMAQPAGLSARTASKFGGQPWGFPAQLWPVCAECGCPMSFLAQFAPGPQVPRIGAAHSLYVFTCERESVCSFWEPDGGANACLHVPHAQMHEAFTPVPAGEDDEFFHGIRFFKNYADDQRRRISAQVARAVNGCSANPGDPVTFRYPICASDIEKAAAGAALVRRVCTLNPRDPRTRFARRRRFPGRPRRLALLLAPRQTGCPC